MPRLGEPFQGAALAHEELEAEFGFEHADLAADARMRGVELLCSGGDVEVALDDGGEIAQLLQGNAASTAVAASARERPRSRSTAFSAIITVGALVLPPINDGITEASMTRKPSTPRTRSSGSTTLVGSLPMRQLPTGW